MPDGPGIRIVVLARRVPLPPRAKCTLLVLSTYCLDKPVAFASVGRIARDSGFGPRTVQRALNDLRSLGLIRPQGKTERGVNRYLLDERAMRQRCKQAGRSLTTDCAEDELVPQDSCAIPTAEEIMARVRGNATVSPPG